MYFCTSTSRVKLLMISVEERLPFLEPQVKGESVATPKPNEPLSNAVRGLQGNKEVPRRDYRYIFAELEISGYSFMPVYSQCFYELVGTEAREPKVNISEEGTECPEGRWFFQHCLP
jgi:hypothetical protein